MGKRSYYRRRSNNEFGDAVYDMVGTANRLGPRGALLIGIAGFVIFYLLLPWIMMGVVDHTKANSVDPNKIAWAKFLNDVFVLRFIHPSEWTGIAILVGCVLLACWKACVRKVRVG